MQLHLCLDGNDFVRWKSDLFSLPDNTACLICWWKLPPGWLLVVCGEPKIKSAIFSDVASVGAPGSPALTGCRDLSCQGCIPKKSNSDGHSNVYFFHLPKTSWRCFMLYLKTKCKHCCWIHSPHPRLTRLDAPNVNLGAANSVFWHRTPSPRCFLVSSQFFKVGLLTPATFPWGRTTLLWRRN